ncbi:MAG: DNA sulfur modification protein DndD [Symploca sp. SIO2G7]|nr:DNA sulfur modification protein DndD [Symploca sp. SIO2G7]
MRFLELVLQNFGPYYGRQVINLCPESQDDSRSIILFGGMNGGGKTTLMDAIRLALYGHRAQCSTRGNLSYSEFLIQSVNRNALPVEQARIELLFEHIENDQLLKYRIVRYWTKKLKDGKDGLGILDGEWLDEGLTNIWDEYIENLLPLGISNLFLFDGEQVKELAELEAPPLVVVEAIRSLLGLELAERLAVDLEILINRKRKALASKQELANLEDIEQKLSQKQATYKATIEEQAISQDQLYKAKDQQQQVSDKFISEGGKIAAERSQLKSQQDTYQANAKQVREEMKALAAGTLPLALIQPLLNQAQIQGQQESRASQATIGKEILQEREQRLLDLLTQLKLPAKKLAKIQDFLAQENQLLEQAAAEQENSWLEADGETLNYLANLLNYYLPQANKLAQEQLAKLQNLEAEVDATERQLAIAASPEAYQQLENNLRQAQTQLAQAQANWELTRRKVEQLDTEIKQLRKKLAEYGEKNIDRKNDEHIINTSAKVQQTLKLFRERLTLRKLNKLEQEVTECFLYLLHKSDLVHRVAIDTEAFSLSLYDLQGQLVPKHRLSAGEKQLLAIAFLWGLARVSGRQLPVAIDTPLGRLDSSHRTNLVERYFPHASHQVILLSTDTEIGQVEVDKLRKTNAIAQEYLLKYEPTKRQTVTEQGYFW